MLNWLQKRRVHSLNSSDTHLRAVREKMCGREACPRATLAVAGDYTTHPALQLVHGLTHLVTLPNPAEMFVAAY